MSELVDLIRSAIEDRLSGNVGIVLSGGLDSSTVACLAPQSLPTFTGYYDEEGFDEREYARLVAHAEHHEILITPEDFVEHFDAMRAHVRPPVMGMGTFGQYMVAKYISQFIDVALSGEGSDELFGGYARTLIVAGEAPPEGYEDYQLPDGYPTDLSEALAYDYAALPDLLAVDDQMTGAFGVEARAPFTDQRIVDYGLALPITERVGKRHLRERFAGSCRTRSSTARTRWGSRLPSWRGRSASRSARSSSTDSAIFPTRRSRGTVAGGTSWSDEARVHRRQHHRRAASRGRRGGLARPAQGLRGLHGRCSR